MSLPNPGMSFTPFDPLPASDLNDMVENIEALAAGTGLNDDSVTAPKIVGFDKSNLTTDSNPYKFAVYRNSAFNFGNNSFAKISFDTELYDTNNNFASGAYTVPVNGFYHFDYGAGVGSSGYVLLALFKNSSEIRRGNELNQAGNTDWQGSGCADLQLTAGDVMEIYGQAGGTLTGQVGQVRTFFDGHLICRS